MVGCGTGYSRNFQFIKVFLNFKKDQKSVLDFYYIQYNTFFLQLTKQKTTKKI